MQATEEADTPWVEELRAADESAVLLDSPHSGHRYPDDFHHACPRALLRETEDMFIDGLYAFAPALGATLIRAHFPRSYLDPNRPADDIDPLLLDPGAAPPASDKSRRGIGLVWRLVDGQPIYDAPLTRGEIDARIERCWRPYHATLRAAWERVTAKHGFGIHLDCHSMPSRSIHYPADWGHRMPHDFIVGTRDGSTASPGLARHVAQALRQHGYTVAVDEVFKGQELVRALADPARDRHALQLEINKRVYMDEQRFEPTAGFARVQARLQALVQGLVALTRADLRAL